jgi:hypothetical protein
VAVDAVVFSVRGVFQEKFICQLIDKVQLMTIFDCSKDEKMRIVV